MVSVTEAGCCNCCEHCGGRAGLLLCCVPTDDAHLGMISVYCIMIMFIVNLAYAVVILAFACSGEICCCNSGMRHLHAAVHVYIGSGSAD